MTCDNKGRTFGTPMKDLLYFMPDCKSYRNRMVSVSPSLRSCQKKKTRQKKDHVRKKTANFNKKPFYSNMY